MPTKNPLHGVEIVNPEDKKHTKNLFLLAFCNHGEYTFAAYTHYFDQALELIGKHMKEKKYTTFIRDFDPEDEYFDETHFAVNNREYYITMPTYVLEIK